MNHLIFLKEFLNKRAAFPFFKRIAFKGTMLHKSAANQNEYPHEATLVRDVPGYLTIDLPETPTKLLKIKSMQGYYIDLSKFTDFSSYIKSVQGPGSRSNLRRYTGRLESCFAIRYQVYYGNMEKKEYNRLFNALRSMLIRRFEEKKESNYELPYLQEIQGSLYKLILEKKASLYVIYDGIKPISIRINMFKGPLAYYILSGYDIDYSRFHPGLIDMAKNTAWLFQNNFIMYDLLKGYKKYKSKWYTTPYNNYHYLVLHHRSFGNFLKFIWKLSRLQLREFILRLIRILHLNSLGKKAYKQLHSLMEKKRKIPQLIEVPEAEKEALLKNMTAIEIEGDTRYQYLRRPVYDKLFTLKWQYQNTRIYKNCDLPVFCLQNGKSRVFIRVQ
jgi:hypothetical protein